MASVFALDAISIHALVKRATSPVSFGAFIFHISIHALVKRATSTIGACCIHDYHFNPRPREEGDFCCWKLENYWDISIHALVKRATCRDFDSRRCSRYFNPRPREEGDATAGEVAVEAVISIHALVKRATNIIIFVHNLGFISIHALVKRATNRFFLFITYKLFQSTPS